uniref:SOS-response transcriptional repressors (RecA-mediated autopeptidases) n=1 Tax=Candidatus Actinomarina minuta TaxID=1389454 RepID=S5DUU7_9ACTN|nr:SOS-response transcriptional repressors (RecA-mediated autopeptidases) [Candidatus Actinomarina minuta]
MVSDKQKNILNFINIFVEKNGYAPSVREICTGVGLKSTSTVQYHLEKLINSGYLQKNYKKSRALTVNSQISKNKIPILGEIAAGSLLMAEENVIGSVNYPNSEETTELFALSVSGDSMIDEGIHEKDLVIIDKSLQIKNGDIGAFLINNTEGTIKFLRNIEGKNYLVPANKNYKKIQVNENVQPIGKVVSLIRDM